MLRVLLYQLARNLNPKRAALHRPPFFFFRSTLPSYTLDFHFSVSSKSRENVPGRRASARLRAAAAARKTEMEVRRKWTKLR